MPLLEIEQYTPEWYTARLGIVTASRVNDVQATIKKGEAAVRRNYRAELIVEAMTGQPVEHFVSKEMEWGTENEPFARVAYEIAHGVTVDQCGFAVHDAIPRFGASPDGLVGADGLVEIKCPNTATHIDYLLSGDVPADYQPQMLAQMACTGRKWCDFVSFDPRMPEKLQLFVRRFQRDDGLIAVMEADVVKFLAEVDQMILRLQEVE